ncbi:hypothetical protein BVG79_01974 [Ketogulonicigenium robustum]|uniref:DUF4304 domain-containing protein n=1 Tax=Ketogulonicigenium robustum TaxID=92947 RepID=A0A1W6P1D5_9RHOB|nr:DUF4304 domain-containing protein [Ketogulonicigenium robustum]ARO15316.1 hypothetical protein BVG79_01974 [Ketogulonicigenium robustum]
MDRKTINRALRAEFFPVLAAEGFTRHGDVARRIAPDGVVHVVDIQHLPRNGAFQVNLGTHLLQLGGVAGGQSPAPETFRDFDCAWRGSIIAGFRNASDAAFTYGATAEQAAESVAFLVSEWPRQSAAFFAPYQSYPDTFHAAAHAAAADDSLHPAHMLTWARVAALLDDAPLAQTIALAALPKVPERATALRDKLHAFLTP